MAVQTAKKRSRGRSDQAELPLGGASRQVVGRPESYRLAPDGNAIDRVVTLRNGGTARTRVGLEEKIAVDTDESVLADRFDRAFLCASVRPRIGSRERDVRVADLFSGCGAMSLGIWEACRAVGARMVPAMALDFNKAALQVYEDNFPGVWGVSGPVETILDGSLGSPPSAAERELIARLGSVDILIGGPPCQGHSNLNNHTRRADPKNKLYERMARLAELVEPAHVIIENVSAVLHDKGKVVDRTIAHLRRLEYSVDDGAVEAVAIGVPQRRRRHFVVASRERKPNVRETMSAFARPERSVSWAIGDLARISRQAVFDQVGTPSDASRERIDYLFSNKLFELPDELRPDCHRLETHSYKSVYGRIRPDSPAQTITSGFLSMGQGRYVHPTQRRTITPHEAARLQFIPDFFAFGSVSRRTALAEMIGNAVPPKLAYVLAVELLR
jgi:DNA (cytosine-5)-methyltransferase 1